MLPDLLALAVVAAVFSVPFVSRRLRAGRVQSAGAAAVSPVRHEAAGGTAVPAATVQPAYIERVPYDDGPLIGGSP